MFVCAGACAGAARGQDPAQPHWRKDFVNMGPAGDDRPGPGSLVL